MAIYDITQGEVNTYNNAGLLTNIFTLERNGDHLTARINSIHFPLSYEGVKIKLHVEFIH